MLVAVALIIFIFINNYHHQLFFLKTHQSLVGWAKEQMKIEAGSGSPLFTVHTKILISLYVCKLNLLIEVD